jgi:hypothetical protein
LAGAKYPGSFPSFRTFPQFRVVSEEEDAIGGHCSVCALPEPAATLIPAVARVFWFIVSDEAEPRGFLRFGRQHPKPAQGGEARRAAGPDLNRGRR